jgi:hypothetical protein
MCVCVCVCEVQKRLRRELVTELPIRLTILRIRDNFEAGDTVQGVHKQKSGKSPSLNRKILLRSYKNSRSLHGNL